jgi:hypothetical protein
MSTVNSDDRPVENVGGDMVDQHLSADHRPVRPVWRTLCPEAAASSPDRALRFRDDPRTAREFVRSKQVRPSMSPTGAGVWALRSLTSVRPAAKLKPVKSDWFVDQPR